MTTYNARYWLNKIPLAHKTLSDMWTKTSPQNKSLPKHLSQHLKTKDDWLPIEWLRDYSADLFAGKTIDKTFLSSGTSQQTRAQSHFSSEGLDLYRKASMWSFKKVLKAKMGSKYSSIKGYSLIPPKDCWQDSSLAQMISWIEQEFPMQYITESEIKSIDCNRPIWIFGTAFHYVNLFDNGLKKSLHPNSIVIETGGTKGKSRSVTKSETYEILTQMFNISTNQVISEYGMCEIATPAWDFCSDNNSTRFYKFPKWVIPAIQTRAGEFSDSGFGSLCFYDPARIDYPWPIRTQDLAQLFPDGSFDLLGRVPSSPLKGCSMQVPTGNGSPKRVEYITTTKRQEPAKYNDPQRIEKAQTVATSLLESSEFFSTLAEEFGNSNIAAAAIQDLWSSVPKDLRAWEAAIQNATRGCNSQSWLIIPPSSHPIAILHPTFIGWAAGLDITIKTSHEAKHGSLFLRDFFRSQLGITSLEPSHNIQQTFDEIILFGSSHTVKFFEKNSEVPVRGFGSSIAAVYATYNQLINSSDKIAKDLLSLNQKGCMSPKILIVRDKVNDDGFETLSENLSEAIYKFYGTIIPDSEAIALEQLLLQLRMNGIPHFRSNEGPVIIKCSVSKAHAILPLLPSWAFIMIDECANEKILGLIRSSSVVKQVVSDEFINIDINCKNLGLANIDQWDGYHEDRSIFGFSTW